MKTILFLIIMFISVGNAYADCGYQLSVPTLSYGLGDNNPTMQGTFTLTRTKNGGPKCDTYFIAFTTGWSGDINNRRTTNTSTSNSFLIKKSYRHSLKNENYAPLHNHKYFSSRFQQMLKLTVTKCFSVGEN